MGDEEEEISKIISKFLTCISRPDLGRENHEFSFFLGGGGYTAFEMPFLCLFVFSVVF